MAMRDRVILTQYPSYTGVGKYVHDLMQMDIPNTKVYTLYFKKNDISRPYYGELVLGSFQFPFTSGWFLNSGFQGLAFRSWRRKISDLEKENGPIFHYTDFGLKPMTSSSNSLLTLHDFFQVSDKYKKYKYKAQPFLKANAKRYLGFEHVIADTAHVAREALDFGFENEPIVVYPPAGEYIVPGMNKIQCRKKHNLPLDKNLILSISSNDPRKNVDAVAGTMKLLGEDYELVRVGPPMEHAFNFRNLTNIEINELYNACDVFLFPTLDEGLGFPLIEAMAAGIPIVSSNIEAVDEICLDAAIKSIPNSENLARGVKEAIGMSDELIAKGKTRSSFFSHENFNRKLREIYASF